MVALNFERCVPRGVVASGAAQPSGRVCSATLNAREWRESTSQRAFVQYTHEEKCRGVWSRLHIPPLFLMFASPMTRTVVRATNGSHLMPNASKVFLERCCQGIRGIALSACREWRPYILAFRDALLKALQVVLRDVCQGTRGLAALEDFLHALVTHRFARAGDDLAVTGSVLLPALCDWSVVTMLYRAGAVRI